MAADIIFEWNVLTTTMVVWAGCISLAIVVDFGPEFYREKKARAQLVQTVARIAEQKAAKPIMLDSETTFHLGVFKIQPEPARRRHARA